MAVAILVLPGLLVDCRRVLPRRGSFPVEPLSIDVERAPWYEWVLLEGIGEVRARRIVKFVRSRRPLGNIRELEEVPGLPPGWLERALPHLRLRRGDPRRPAEGASRTGGARAASGESPQAGRSSVREKNEAKRWDSALPPPDNRR